MKFLILSALLGICIQDILARAVHWFLFPLLYALFLALRLLFHQQLSEVWQSMAVDFGFLFIQLTLVSAWFSLKKKAWVNITAEMIGWGDILFLISLGFYLSFLNYLFFYIASLLFILPMWLCWLLIFDQKNKQLPLAGLQALAAAIWLSADWWITNLNVTDDYWLLKLINK